MNTHPRREAITSEIRVQEEKLKDIASNVEKDTKVRDQLRAKSDEQNEIDMVSFVLLSVAITLVYFTLVHFFTSPDIFLFSLSVLYLTSTHQ